MKLHTVDSYILSKNTYLVESIKHEDKLFSRVYDKTGEIIVRRKPLKLIRDTCKMMGGNYNSARSYSKSFFGNEKHKLPIIVSHNYGIPCVFFPLYSPTSPNNVWVGLHAIINIRKKNNTTVITLKDDREITLFVNYSSFCSQYVCATMLHKHFLNQRLILEQEHL